MRVPPLLVVVALSALLSGQDAGYRKPPEPIASLVVAEPTPDVGLSPDRRWLLLTSRRGLPDIGTVARPHRKLAGLRIDPESRGPQLSTITEKVVLRRLADGQERTLALPPGHFGNTHWSADGEHLAFTQAAAGGYRLWLCATADGSVRRIDGVQLNCVLGSPLRWLPDQRSLLCRLTVAGDEPPLPSAPAGPEVQETGGGVKAQVRTNPDMLQNEDDAARFAWFAEAQLAVVDVTTGAVTPVGAPGAIVDAEPSPDGQLLLITRLRRPFSYLVPWMAFPQVVELCDRQGTVLRTVAQMPLRENVPIGGVPTGPRGIEWLPGHPHTLLWAEALDGGDPKTKVEQRDAVHVLADPAGEPRLWFRSRYRFGRVSIAADRQTVLMAEADRQLRRQRLSRLDLNDFSVAPVELWERSSQDAYTDPGRPIARTTPTGESRLITLAGELLLAGEGASKDGDRPFLDRWNPRTGDKRRVWQCRPGRHETFVGVLDDEAQRILIRSESRTEPPNWYQVELASGVHTPWTTFSDPALEHTSKIGKQLLRYQRADGVPLSGTLYTPPGWQAGTKLPVLIWAYPQEFTQASDAGQVRSQPDRYVRLAGSSHLWLLLAGYAVFDDAAMPIVGDARSANDTFVTQLVQNAEAAVKVLVDSGVADPRKIAVAGHSYGGFMTANLLCHTDLFAAGIARSGAYNRTLTPFGFQNEERTYWEAPAVYHTMSPFSHAHRVQEPILLIHGADDNNQGTWPLQSQRFYAAIKGHGGTARLVMLPAESHGYRAQESVLHCLFEMVSWLDRHVKNRPEAKSDARPAGGGN
ncbi:MAG: S9 family peptidase [Planctomycetes bacterium]|nr:S9 family peptidase [Planctomycetota bacterium]